MLYDLNDILFIRLRWTSGSDLVMYKTGNNQDDNNWLLTTGDNNEGNTQDWSAKTNQNERSYAIRADVIASKQGYTVHLVMFATLKLSRFCDSIQSGF